MNHGYGKVILFGEHFVVHDLPAIVASLPWSTIASVRVLQNLDQKILLDDKRPRIPGVKYLESKYHAYNQLAKNIVERMGIIDNLEITLAGDLVVSSGGIGASAATAVALTRALNNFYNLNLPDNEIHEIALHGERAVHGNPSGIDTTAATYGGLFVFQKNKDIKFLDQTNSTKIVLIDSGFTMPTSEVITLVKKFKDNNPELVNSIISHYKNIVQEAENNRDNLARLGALMNENHELLRQIGVSTPELDTIVSVACGAGALGAKITGTGRGGLILALTSDDTQDRVAHACQRLGYKILCTEMPI